MDVVSKEVESTIEYVCKIEACMETHNQVGIKKQQKCQWSSLFINKNIANTPLGSKDEETSTAIESVYLLLYFHNRNT